MPIRWHFYWMFLIHIMILKYIQYPIFINKCLSHWLNLYVKCFRIFFFSFCLRFLGHFENLSTINSLSGNYRCVQFFNKTENRFQLEHSGFWPSLTVTHKFWYFSFIFHALWLMLKVINNFWPYGWYPWLQMHQGIYFCLEMLYCYHYQL